MTPSHRRRPAPPPRMTNRVIRAMLVPLLVATTTALAPAIGMAEDAPLSHGLAMHGDLKYPADFKHFAYANPDAPKGGTARIAAIGTFDSFNPFIIKGNPAGGTFAQTYDTLMVNAADEPFSEYGLLAETVQTPEDRSWVAFTLRETARWHDGKPITVEDVIWSFNTLVSEGAPFYRFYYGSVAEVTQTGPRTVKFTFKGGENRELPLILGQLPVLPKHYWESRTFNESSLEPPLGSGPYKLGKFEPGRFYEMERVEDYWGRDLPVNKGRDNFDVMRVDYFRDSTVAIEGFKGGAFDFRRENSSKEWATAYEIPEVENGLIVKELVPHNRPAGMQGFAFNTRREIFKDPLVRQALGYAFDFEWSNKTLFYGQYARTRSYFDNSELAATGLPSPAELEILEPLRGQIPNEVFTTEYVPPKTDGSGKIRDQLKTAVDLFKQAGWEIRDRKMTNLETGKPLTFELLLVSPLFERIALPFKKSLSRIGVDMSVRTVDTAQFRELTDSFSFDMVVGTWGQSLSPGNEQREFWGSDAADREGSRNVIGIKDPAIDSLIETLIAAPDRKALVTRVRALDRVLRWGHWVIPQFHIDQDRLVYWNKFGRPEITPDQGFQFDTWWIDPKLEEELREKQGRRR